MNRRSFLKFAGLAPIVPMVTIKALSKNPVVLVNHNTSGIDPNILMPDYRIAETMWNNDRSDPGDALIEGMRILDKTMLNKPRHYVISPRQWERLKDLGLIDEPP